MVLDIFEAVHRRQPVGRVCTHNRRGLKLMELDYMMSFVAVMDSKQSLEIK
jgi:hypothetical protein